MWQFQLCTRSALVRSDDFPSVFNELTLLPTHISAAAHFYKLVWNEAAISVEDLRRAAGLADSSPC